MTGSGYQVVNAASSHHLQLTGASFSLLASPNTDIYASPHPPAKHVFTAPIAHEQIARSSFKEARVTVSAKWKLTYDQGGLIFTEPSPENPFPNADNAKTASTHPAWVKAGIEMYEGKPYVSVVSKAKNGWCDWSLKPVDPSQDKEVSVTLEMTRHENALMIWQLGREKGDRTLVRKVPWVFLHQDEPDNAPSSDVAYVGVYAARPDPNGEAAAAKDGHQELEVFFHDLHILEEDSLE